jgi:hypothetical protein
MVMRRVLFVMVVATAACGGGSTSPPASPFAGTYRLQSWNGQPLPAVVGQGTTSVVLTGDTLTLAGAGTWSETTTYQLVQAGQTTNEVTHNNGSWTRSGTNLSLRAVPYNAVAYSGSFSTNRLDFSDGKVPYVFTK